MIPPSQPSERPSAASSGDPTPTGPFLGEAAPIPPTTVGRRQIGRFELRGLLGQGAFGTVYRAYDPQLDREVALKVPRFPPNRPDLVERFLREARSAARLRHPGIVATFEVGTASGEQFIVSELVTGQTLRERLNSGEPPTVRQAVGWVRDLALALEYAHSQGIIHRDIKPSNIMIDAHNRAQLMDFGLAKRLDSADPTPATGDNADNSFSLGPVVGDAMATPGETVQAKPGARPLTNSATYALLTADGAVLGTPAYMSPEQASAASEAIGPRSDQYSLGVVLYEVLTGRLPFEGSLTEMLRQVADPTCQARSPRDLNRQVPAPLAAVCSKALAKEPAQRYGSAAEFAVDLQHWLNDQPVRAYSRPRRGADQALSSSRGRRWPIKVRRLADWCRGHQRSVLAAMLGLALVVAVAGTSWYVANLRHQAEAARRTAIVALCDLYRERGRTEGNAGQSVRFLAESLAMALELEDEPRQQVAARILAERDWPLPRPPGMDGDSGLRWDLAAHLLLGQRLPSNGGWENLGERLPHAGQRTGFGAGGNKVLTANLGLLRDARTGEQFSQSIVGPDPVFVPGGQRAVRVGEPLIIWDLASGDEFKHTPEQDWKPSQWGCSPDGTKLVVLSARHVRGTKSRSGGYFLAVQIWDMTKVKQLTEQSELEGVRHQVSAIAVSNDGLRVVLATPLAVHMATISKSAVRGVIEVPASEISAASFFPDGRRLLIAEKKQVELWEWSAGRAGEFLPAGGVRELVISPQGWQVLTRGGDGWQLWDMHSRRRVGLPLERLAKVQRVDFHPGGRQLLTAADGDARLWPNPVIAAADRPKALRLWAQASTGLTINAAGDLDVLDPLQREECRQRFDDLAGLSAEQRGAD